MCLVLALALGVSARVVVAADMALGMSAAAGDMPGNCGDCGDGDAGVALCHLVCGNPAGLGIESPLGPPAAVKLRRTDVADAAAGRSVPPEPSPPRPAPMS